MESKIFRSIPSAKPKRYRFKRLYLTVLLFVCSDFAFSQVGDNMQNPIIVGTFEHSFEYADLQNTNDFTNIFGDLTLNTNDVFLPLYDQTEYGYDYQSRNVDFFHYQRLFFGH
jgi:hypothetical protein